MILGVSALILGPIIGFLIVFVFPNQEWFARVNGVEISRAELVDVLRAQQIDASLSRAPFDPTLEVFDAAARLTDDEVLRQTAGALGVVVDEADIEAELIAELAPDLDPSDLNEAERAQFEERRRQYVDLRRLSISQLERLAEGELLRRGTAQALGRQTPGPQPQVHLHVLTVPDIPTAERVRSEAAAGVVFEEIVRRHSIGGPSDLGWLPYGALPPAAADLLWSLPPLEMSPPFQQEDQAIVLYVVSARDPSRELDPVVRQLLEERALASWLRTTRAAQQIELQLDSETLTWVSQQLERTRAVTPGA